VHATHSVNHLFANLDSWWVKFRIMPKNVAKVNMEEMTCWGTFNPLTLFNERVKLVRTIRRN
jgi:hypothetical protein